MGFIKKAFKKLTGADDAEKRAREEAERARREQEEAIRKQAELDAAQRAATELAGEQEVQAESVGDTTESTQKKKLRAGRKSLTVARAGGSGINI